MAILETIDQLIKNIKIIDKEIKKTGKQIKRLEKAKKRAQYQESKDRIETYQIVPLKENIKKLRFESNNCYEELSMCEYAVIQEEIASRDTKSIIPVTDMSKFFGMFGRLRRFGNFEGYLAGRIKEIEDYLKDRILEELISNKKHSLLNQNPNITEKDAIKQARQYVFRYCSSEELEAQMYARIDKYLSTILPKNNSQVPQDFWKRVIKLTPSEKPKTPTYNRYEKSNGTKENNNIAER